MRHLGEDIGRGRCHYDHIGRFCERYVARAPIGRFFKLANRNRIARKRPEREGSHELAGMFGHDDMHVIAVLDEQAHQFAGLVGRDRSGHSKDYRCHSFSSA